MKRLTRLACLLLALLCCPMVSAEQLDDRTLLSFYDNTIFFGDSRLVAFRRYVSARQETDATFLDKTILVARDNMSLYGASRNYASKDSLFYFRGRKMTLYNIAARYKPRKIFVLLGLNDAVAVHQEKALTWVKTLISEMRETVPDTEVCFFSETPVTAKYEHRKNRSGFQRQQDEYNRLLKQTCEENGACYVEIAEALKGEDNLLNPDYSSDGICHFNENGVIAWIGALEDYAQQQYDLGLWTPRKKGNLR